MFYRTADAVLTITAEDRNRILSVAKANGPATVLDPQRITPLPMVSEAVGDIGDGAIGAAIGAAVPRSFERRAGLVMVGNGANPVNRISVEWFLRYVTNVRIIMHI